MNEAEITERKARREAEAACQWARRGRRCSTCKAQVFFAKNIQTGKWQIIDALPNWAKGNIYLSGWATHQLTARVWDEQIAASNRASGVAYHTDHHATCPHAEEHRAVA